MSDENNEKKLSEEIEDEAVAQTESKLGDDWTWDAAVPETQTENITFEDLSVPSSMNAEKDEEKTEEPEQNETSEEVQTEENEEAEKDDGCCIVCGKSLQDSPSELYCKECHEKFLRTDYGVGHIILAFVMVLVAVVGYFVCASTLPLVPKVLNAEKLVAEKRYEDAMNLCMEMDDDVATVNAGINAIFTSINTNGYADKEWLKKGRTADVITLESYANMVTVMDSNYITFVESTFVDGNGNFDHKMIEKPKYDKIRKVYDLDKELYSLGNEYGEALRDYYTYDENSQIVIDYDKAMKYLDGIEAKTQAEKCMQDYYRSAIIVYTEKGQDKLFGYLDALMENAGEYSYMFSPYYIDAANRVKDYDKIIEVAKGGIEKNANDTYSYYYLINAYFAKNDLDSADKYLENMKKGNPDITDYYVLKAELCRRQGKFEDAIAVCTKGIAKEENSELYRQQSIAYMLLDNTAKAAETAKQAYDVEMLNVNTSQEESMSLDVVNTTALIMFLCNGSEDETYKSIMSIFKEQGIELDEKAQLCIKGEIEFSDIFMKGDFDLV